MARAGDRIVIRTEPTGWLRIFELTADIGSRDEGAPGGMGRVFGAREVIRCGDGERLSGTLVAVKFVNREREDEAAADRRFVGTEVRRLFRDALRHEAALLDLVRKEFPDPHAVNMIGMVCAGVLVEPAVDSGYPALVMEYCGFTLRRALGAPTAADAGSELERVRRRLAGLPGLLGFLQDALTALCALAKLPHPTVGRYTHRDIKPSNYLYKDGHFLTADFGTAKFQNGATRSLPALSECYAAPEVWHESQRLQADPAAGFHQPIDYAQADIFSVYVVLFECLVGRLPFFQSSPARSTPAGVASILTGDEEQLLDRAAAGLPDGETGGDGHTLLIGGRPADWTAARNELPAMIRRCLSLDPADRPRAEDLLEQVRRWMAPDAAPVPAAAAAVTLPAVMPPIDRFPAAAPVMEREGIRRPASSPRRRFGWRVPAMAAGILGAVATAGAVSVVNSVVPVTFVAPAAALAAAPARWSEIFDDPVKPLCDHALPALPSGQRLVFSARFGDGSRPGPAHPLAVLVPAQGPLRMAGPGTALCGRAPSSDGASWGCSLPVGGSGPAALVVLARRSGAWDPIALAAEVDRRFPAVSGTRPPEAVARFLVDQASGGRWTMVQVEREGPACR